VEYENKKCMIMNKKRISSGLVFMFILLIFSITSCMKSDDMQKEQLAQIQLYLDNHPDLDFELKNSGLYYLETIPGSGPVAATHDTAYLFFSGYLLDGTSFLSNSGTTDTLISPVNENLLILGIDEAITYMREGGHCKILFPSELGYGNSGYYLNAYTPLIFDLYLAKLVPGPGGK
jgi:FKBP-type peptidyl-prolyl cis-trans isomerase